MIGKYTGVVALTLGAGLAHGSVQFANPSFETDSDWTTMNDAELAFAGGEAGWVWNTPVAVGATWTSQEDVTAPDGESFAITYAGLDSISQSILIPEAGTYEFSLDWNGIEGFFTNSDGSVLGSGTGVFRLFADTAFGGGSRGEDVLLSDAVTATTAGGWETFTWSVDLPAGEVLVGVENIELASYAIGFDNFRVVPAPGAFGVVLAGGLLARRRRA